MRSSMLEKSSYLECSFYDEWNNHCQKKSPCIKNLLIDVSLFRAKAVVRDEKLLLKLTLYSYEVVYVKLMLRRSGIQRDRGSEARKLLYNVYI